MQQAGYELYRNNVKAIDMDTKVYVVRESE